MVIRRQKLGWHFLLRRQLDLYGGVLWSGELQGFIVHETVPTGISDIFPVSNSFDSAEGIRIRTAASVGY
jgi:hypothetical protein